MANLPDRAGPTALTTSAAAIYTANGASTYSVIRSIIVTNEDTVARTFTIGINTSATDAAGKRTFAKDQEVGPGQSWTWPPQEGAGFMPLLGHASTPDILYALASAATALTITVGLVEGP